MLTPQDYDLIRRDRALPGLATALDAEALAARLCPWLAAPVEAAEAAYVRYKPGMNVLVAHRLRIQGRAHEVYVKAHRLQDTEKLDKALSKAGPEEGGPGFGCVVLGDESLVVLAFPHDAKLRSLGRLADPASLQRLLKRVLPHHPAWWEGALHTLRYKPERRYVARLDVDGAAVAVLKFFTGSSHEAVRSKAKVFGEHGVLRLAPRVGHSDRHRIMAYAWLDGRVMSEALVQGDLAGPTEQVGAALALLHGQGRNHGALPLRSRADEERMVRAVAESLAFVQPALAARARALAKSLVGALAQRPLAPRPIHGDFYAKQLLLDGETVVVLDFDGSALGDPAADVGNFIAHLERDRLRGILPEHRVARTRAALLEGYRGEAGPLAPEAVDLYAAAGLFLLAPHPFRFREPDWPVRTEAILAQVEALLRAAEARPPDPVPQPVPDVAVVEAPGVSNDAALPFLPHALNPASVRQAFQTNVSGFLGSDAEVVVHRARLARHKPGRRCLIDYEAEVQRPGKAPEALALIGKARAKGLDRATYRLMVQLRKGGFGGESADGLLVPEPVGCVPAFNMWLQRRVPGENASDVLLRPEGSAVARRIARGLCRLHRQGPRPERRHTIDDELGILGRCLSQVAEKHPRWRGRLANILNACERLGTLLHAPASTPIHRDFYADNVLVDGDRVYLLDFDLYCLGDPALDAGNFIGHIFEQRLRSGGHSAWLTAAERAFEDAFVASYDESIRPRVHAYITLTLARHIYISTLFPERRAFTEALIEACEERLSGVLVQDARAAEAVNLGQF